MGRDRQRNRRSTFCSILAHGHCGQVQYLRDWRWAMHCLFSWHDYRCAFWDSSSTCWSCLDLTLWMNMWEFIYRVKYFLLSPGEQFICISAIRLELVLANVGPGMRWNRYLLANNLRITSEGFAFGKSSPAPTMDVYKLAHAWGRYCCSILALHFFCLSTHRIGIVVLF